MLLSLSISHNVSEKCGPRCFYERRLKAWMKSMWKIEGGRSSYPVADSIKLRSLGSQHHSYLCSPHSSLPFFWALSRRYSWELVPAAYGWDLRDFDRIEAWVTNMLRGEKRFGRESLWRCGKEERGKGIFCFGVGKRRTEIALGKNLSLRKECMRKKISKTGIETSECKWKWNEEINISCWLWF